MEERGGETSHEMAVELIQAIASTVGSRSIAEDEKEKAIADFERNPGLIHAVAAHFATALDRDEDAACDALRAITSTTANAMEGHFAASFLPHAIRQVMSSVYHGTVDLKLPLHRFVIASNNKMARLFEIGLFDADFPDLRFPSTYHNPKPYHMHANLKKLDEGRAETGPKRRGVPKVFSGECVNSCLSSEIFVGALSCCVYHVRSLSSWTHLDMIALCLHTLSQGIKSLEYKSQIIGGRMKEGMEATGEAEAYRTRAKVVEVERKGAKGSDLVARYAISGDMYVVMSQALAYLKNCHDNPLVGEMATLALHLMKERATLDMSPEGIVLSTSLIS